MSEKLMLFQYIDIPPSPPKKKNTKKRDRFTLNITLSHSSELKFYFDDWARKRPTSNFVIREKYQSAPTYWSPQIGLINHRLYNSPWGGCCLALKKKNICNRRKFGNPAPLFHVPNKRAIQDEYRLLASADILHDAEIYT
jgi:hypothetical protein